VKYRPILRPFWDFAPCAATLNSVGCDIVLGIVPLSLPLGLSIYGVSNAGMYQILIKVL
jgi:hypothetical protein